MVPNTSLREFIGIQKTLLKGFNRSLKKVWGKVENLNGQKKTKPDIAIQLLTLYFLAQLVMSGQ
jgi:hypothetical protein